MGVNFPMIVRVTILAVLTMHCNVRPQSAADEPFTPERPARVKVLMDYYHHAEPSTRIGDSILTGGYTNTLGRYGLNDFSHTNGFDPVVNVLEDEFALYFHRDPLTKQQLEGADIVFIFMPEPPEATKDVPLISNEEISDLVDFVKQGGSLLLTINSYNPTETLFEQVQFRKLIAEFGLDWSENDTKYVDIHVGPYHPYFYDMDVFHYGAGCTLRSTGSTEPVTVLEVHNEVGSEPVRGPGISLVRYGKGKVLVCGDTGSWGGNQSRPWTDNSAALLQIFRLCKPDTGIGPPKYQVGQTLAYRMGLSRISVFGPTNALNTLPQPGAKQFIISGDEELRLPYLECTATVNLRCESVDDEKITAFDAELNDLRCFYEVIDNQRTSKVQFKASRLGSIGKMECSSDKLGLAPEFGHLIPFVPNDGVRVGDRWKKRCEMRVNPAQCAASGAIRTIDTTMCYLGDERINNRDCRVFLTSASFWLNELTVSVEDLLPEDWLHRHGKERFELERPRGGGFLFKRQQWIDRDTGVVVHARAQSRILAWVRDSEKPKRTTIAEIDNDMITVAAQDVVFELQ